MSIPQRLSNLTFSIFNSPWIPIIPESQQSQDLSENWQQEDDV